MAKSGFRRRCVFGGTLFPTMEVDRGIASPKGKQSSQAPPQLPFSFFRASLFVATMKWPGESLPQKKRFCLPSTPSYRFPLFVPAYPFCNNHGNGQVTRFPKRKGFRLPKPLLSASTYSCWCSGNEAMNLRTPFKETDGLLGVIPFLNPY